MAMHPLYDTLLEWIYHDDIPFRQETGLFFARWVVYSAEIDAEGLETLAGLSI
jgi:hypothetical protein